MWATTAERGWPMIRSEIICDGCGIKGEADFYRYNRWKAHIGRSELHEQGWKVGEPHGKDHCPKCVAEDSGDCGWMARQGAGGGVKRKGAPKSP